MALAAEMALWYQASGRAALQAKQMGQRVAILAIGAFLLAGLVMLMFVLAGYKRVASTQVTDGA